MMSCRGAKLPTMPNLIKPKGRNFQERATLIKYDKKSARFSSEAMLAVDNDSPCYPCS